MKALAMLPIVLIRPAFTFILVLPELPDQVVNLKLASFREYFENTWINGRYPLQVWSHWDNPGPRTTNHAEGYHNRLNMADLRDTNLAMRNFLHLFQPLHNRDQIRVRNLRRQVIQPKPRNITYVDLDNRIEAAKQQLWNNTGHIWNVANFEINNMLPDQYQFLMAEMHAYLRYVRHMVGKKTRVALVDD